MYLRQRIHQMDVGAVHGRRQLGALVEGGVDPQLQIRHLQRSRVQGTLAGRQGTLAVGPVVLVTTAHAVEG
eukprot:4355573-Pyramimonas_sp.AAC.1